jgi:tRNA-2-methylthio-N6-dimethylallyladenosine synthase
LPVQSGSTEVLKKMSRKYSREHYSQLVAKIKTAIPDVVLTTDIIVGFPGETEEQFEDTMQLVHEVGFDMAFSFIYSPREGTPAAEMEDNVPMEAKKQRLYRLNEALNEYSKISNEKLRGELVEVLVEGESKNNPDVLSGRTRTNKMVHFTGSKDLIGHLVQVKVLEAQTWVLKGELAVEPLKLSI